MRRFLIFVAFVFPVAVGLQPTGLTRGWADPAPIPQAFDIRLDAQQLTVIQQALMKVAMPYEQTAPVLQSLSQQIHDQAQSKEEKR